MFALSDKQLWSNAPGRDRVSLFYPPHTSIKVKKNRCNFLEQFQKLNKYMQRAKKRRLEQYYLRNIFYSRKLLMGCFSPKRPLPEMHFSLCTLCKIAQTIATF